MKIFQINLFPLKLEEHLDYTYKICDSTKEGLNPIVNSASLKQKKLRFMDQVAVHQYHIIPPTLIDALEDQEQSFLNFTTQSIEESSPITEIFINGFTIDAFLKLNVENITCRSKEMENDILTLVNTWMNSTGQSYSEASTEVQSLSDISKAMRNLKQPLNACSKPSIIKRNLGKTQLDINKRPISSPVKRSHSSGRDKNCMKLEQLNHERVQSRLQNQLLRFMPYKN